MDEKNLGLTAAIANQKLEEFGPNALPEKPPPSDFSIFLSQLKSPLVYILLVATAVTFVLKDYSDTIIISIAVFVNTILGFLQERRAENALSALKKLIHPEAEVIRDGKRVVVDAESIVPGDVCIINTGDKIPADGHLITSNRFFASEAILTGESVPVAKNQGDKVFMGTIVTSGEARMLVEKTGSGTEIGKIAVSIQEPFEDTPLRRQLSKFGSQLTKLVVALTFFVFLIGVVAGKPLVEIFTTSVALAVSAIPEGLLVGLTVVLAIGMQRILKRKGLVRNLVSAETLGGVTAICVDKTGTLTEGKMRVTDVIGDKTEIAKQAIIANDLDDPIVISMWEWAEKHLKPGDMKGENVNNYLEKHPRIDSIPFSSKDRFFACLNKVSPNQKVLFVSGAPEFLLEWSDLLPNEKKKIKENIESLTSKGKRVVGLAKKEVPFTKTGVSTKDVKHDLTWVGLIGFDDPLRSGVKEALALTKSAGVKLFVITGDYAQTAVSIMGQLGIQVPEGDIILGSELSVMNESKLASLLSSGSIKLFARTTPHQKLKIVASLKKNGEVVAMTGDGVNDAPALKKADIGIVVGEASDVAKESADIVLLDSSFSTIVSAIEEGRGIFDNIRKIILYLMSDAFEEIVAVIGVIVIGIITSEKLPLPVTAAQILWINLVSDGFPHLALTVDPKEEGIMDKPPRNPNEPIVSDKIKKLIFLTSLWGGITALSIFWFFYKTTGDLSLARSVSFATLGVNSLVYVFSVRNLHKPVWRENPFRNKWLNLAVLFGIVFQVFPFLFAGTRTFFELEILNATDWGVIFGASVIMFVLIETMKDSLKIE